MVRGFKGTSFTVAVMMLLALFAAEGARAQPAHARPASGLFFPLYDARPNKGTLITVTNINDSRTSCQNSFRNGDVCVHYVYYDSQSNDCLSTDRTECLTPGDTLTVVASKHNPNITKGWLWVEARDPETMLPINFNYLVGSAIVISTAEGQEDTDFLWSYTPYAFRAVDYDGDASRCGHKIVDKTSSGVGDDGTLFADFDGIEYETFPSTLYVDNFFAENDPNFDVDNRVFVMVPDGFGGNNFNLSLLFFDNDETEFSASRSIGCFLDKSLSELSTIVFKDNLAATSVNELPHPTMPGVYVYTGWVRIQVRSGIQTVGSLGVFFQQTDVDSAGGHELQFQGSADIPVSLFREDLIP